MSDVIRGYSTMTGAAGRRCLGKPGSTTRSSSLMVHGAWQSSVIFFYGTVDALLASTRDSKRVPI